MSTDSCYKRVNNYIRQGMATILWGDAWANHVEASAESGEPCYRLSGKEITEVMPEIPQVSWQLACKLRAKYKRVNSGLSIVELFVKGQKINYSSEDSDEDTLKDFASLSKYDPDSPTRFGECLAYMSLGHGVSWFDDHTIFPIKVPSIDNYTLQDWARERCKKCNEN